MSCYYPNGNPSSGDIPCSSDDVSACCPSGWKCESNGLCSLANQGYYGRYTCTDKTWESDNCPQVCTHSNTAAGAEAVLQCSSGQFCCDANRPDAKDQNPPKPGCCDTSNSRFSLDALPIIAGSNKAAASSSTKIGSSSTTSSPTTSSSSSTTPSPTTSSSTTSSNTPTLRSISLQSSTTSLSTTSSTPSPKSSTVSSQASPSSSSPATSSTNSQAAHSTSSSSASVSVVTSVITSNGGQSTLLTSTSAPVLAPASGTAVPHPKSSVPILGPAIGAPVAVLAIAALILFFCLRRRRSRREHPSPQTGHQQDLMPMYGEPKPPFPAHPELYGSPVTASFNKDAALYHDPSTTAHSSSTASPNYRGSSGFYGTQHANGYSRGTDSMGSPTAAARPTTAELHAEAPMEEMGEGARPPSELLGNTYRPYRPPGAGVQR